MFRYPIFESAMNTFFDGSDAETRRVLLAVNEEDQSRVLTMLASKLYDAIVDKVDDIDYGEVPSTKGDITKLSNYSQMLDVTETIHAMLSELKQPTKNNIEEVRTAINNVRERKDIFSKGYMLNKELPMMVYSTMVLSIMKSISLMISTCIEFIKDTTSDTYEVVLNKQAVVKSEHSLLFENLKKFNMLCRSGDVDKMIDYVNKTDSKQFLGGPLVVGGAILGVALVMNIIPIARECIYFFYYNRVRISDYLALQADLLQMNAYMIEQNRPDLTKEEKKSIIKRQDKIAQGFRKASDAIAVDCKASEAMATKQIATDSKKKYKIDDVVDQMPDSATPNPSIF